MKKSLVAGIALAVVLSGGSFFSPAPTLWGPQAAYASVSQMTVSESTMYTKMSNRTRFAIYTGSGSSYYEYASLAKGPDAAASELVAAARSGSFLTSNSSLYQALMRQRGVRYQGYFVKYGTTIYRLAW